MGFHVCSGCSLDSIIIYLFKSSLVEVSYKFIHSNDVPLGIVIPLGSWSGTASALTGWAILV